MKLQMEEDFFSHLGIFSDWVKAAEKQQPLFSDTSPGSETIIKLRESLGFTNLQEFPQDVRTETTWEQDGVSGEEISWQTGYGPRTHAWFYMPSGSTEPLPCVLALHDHGGFKYYGKEKIATGVFPANQVQKDWFTSAYGGRPWVNALAKRGFAVLVHDTFLWGSRKFPIETMEKSVWFGLPDESKIFQNKAGLDDTAWYNFLAAHHEHLVAKYCNLLGTCLAGVVSHEDRIALNYLLSRHDIDPENSACMGLSGGGNRAVLLRATAENLKAAVVVGLMSTYRQLLDHNISTHTWMFFPTNWSRHGDWPDIAGCRAPLPLLVQYDREDELFTLKGMQDAHQRLTHRYTDSGNPEAYDGQFYPGPHKFDIEMQEAAFDWLEKWLK